MAHKKTTDGQNLPDLNDPLTLYRFAEKKFSDKDEMGLVTAHHMHKFFEAVEEAHEFGVIDDTARTNGHDRVLGAYFAVVPEHEIAGADAAHKILVEKIQTIREGKPAESAQPSFNYMLAPDTHQEVDTPVDAVKKTIHNMYINPENTHHGHVGPVSRQISNMVKYNDIAPEQGQELMHALVKAPIHDPSVKKLRDNEVKREVNRNPAIDPGLHEMRLSLRGDKHAGYVPAAVSNPADASPQCVKLALEQTLADFKSGVAKPKCAAETIHSISGTMYANDATREMKTNFVAERRGDIHAVYAAADPVWAATLAASQARLDKAKL